MLHYVVSGRSGTFCHAVTRPRSSRRCQGACTLGGRGVTGTLGIEPGPRHGRASPQGACTLCGRGVTVTPGCPLAEGARVAAYGARLGGGQRGRQWRGEAEGLVAGASAHGSWGRRRHAEEVATGLRRAREPRLTLGLGVRGKRLVRGKEFQCQGLGLGLVLGLGLGLAGSDSLPFYWQPAQ